MSANAISDLALARNISTIPREFFPDFEERTEFEVPSSVLSPLECLLLKEDMPAEIPEVMDGFCLLPSRHFKDDGIYFTCSPQAAVGAVVRDDVRAYVSSSLPVPLQRDDYYESLPKFVPIRIKDKCTRYESHGKRGRKPLLPKNQKASVRRMDS